jgi:hypothetical protein
MQLHDMRKPALLKTSGAERNTVDAQTDVALGTQSYCSAVHFAIWSSLLVTRHIRFRRIPPRAGARASLNGRDWGQRSGVGRCHACSGAARCLVLGCGWCVERLSELFVAGACAS